MRSWRTQAYRFGDLARRTWWAVRRPATRGVKCLIEHDGCWLMVRNTYGHRRWTFPGGGVGRREGTEAAVRREVREEVGVTLGAVEQIGVYPGTTKQNDIVTVYSALIHSAHVEIHPGEIAEARWFDPAALPQERSAAVDTIVSMLRDRHAGQ